MKKSLLLSILALLLTIPLTMVAAEKSVDVGQLRYTVDTDANTAEVYGLILSNEKIHNLVIPDFIDYNGSQIPVTSIRSMAFSECSGLTGSLTIGDNVTTIGNSAFEGCYGFTGSLTIGDSVTTIGKSAFRNCTRFTGSLIIGDSVTTIEDSAFRGCNGFTGSLTIGNSVTTIGDYAFWYCTGFTGSLTIGNSVTSIGKFAFQACSGFTGSLTVGNSVTTIGDAAFWRCSGFTGSLTIGNSVTSIGNSAFVGCSGFTGSLTIGDSVTSIGNSAFDGCSNLSSLDIKSKDLKINYWAFSSMDALQSITCYASTPPECIYSGSYNSIFSSYTPQLYVPQQAIEKYKTATEWEKFTNINPISVTVDVGQLRYTIDTDANTAEVYGPISSDEKIHNLVIPDFINYNGSQVPVTSIRDKAFYKEVWTVNDNITGTLTIGNNIQSIGAHAFCFCSRLTGSLTIGDSVTTIGERAFGWCEGFTGTLTLGNSVTTIGDHAFTSCTGFTGSLTIGDSVRSIGDWAFYGCIGFTGSLNLGDSVTTIGSDAFHNCSGFTGSLTIGNSVTEIGGNTFQDCSGFTGSLTIGDSVTSIGVSAFFGVRNITSLWIESTDLKIGVHAFCDMDALQSVTCYSLTPPECVHIENYSYNYLFSSYTPQLYVPQQAIEKYRSDTEWEKFTNIKPIPDTAISISLNKSELNLTVGESETLIASLQPENATETVTWSSADEAVATVDADGLVKAVGVGTTTITATTVDGLTAECSVTVTEDSGVSGIYDNGLRVSVRGSVITVSGAGDKVVRILAADGKPVFTAQGDCHANVLPGFYLVVVGDNVTKVVAKC